MSTTYADLDAVVPGDGATVLTPWDATQFKTIANGGLPAGTIIKVKGEHDYGSDPVLGAIFIQSDTIGGTVQNPIYVENWTTNPARIKCSNFRIGWGSVLKNTVVECIDLFQVLEGSQLLDCQVQSARMWYWDAEDPTPNVNQVKGCSCIAPDMRGGPNPSQLGHTNLIDSIIDGVLTNFGNVNSSNCAYTAASIPTGGTHTNGQTGWVPPTWPAWNAAQSSFSNGILGLGLHTPPLPGTSPYTGYDKGLFESVRTGIGAFDFDTVPLAVGTRYIAKVTANGWIKDHIYEYDGVQWIDTPPVEGACVVIKELFDTYTYLNGAWTANDVPWLDPVISIFDNTVALPVSPANGDRYIALVTANGWTIDNVYEWNGNNWIATTPSAGMFTFNNDDGLPYLYSGSAWVPFNPFGGPAGGDLAGTYPNPTVAQASKSFKFTGIITDTINAQKDNYNPAGLADASTIQLTLTGDQTITGIAGGVAGRILIIQSGYTGSTDKLTLKNNSGSSLAVNRFYCPLSTDFVLSDDNCVILQYDGVQQKWIVIATCQAPYGTAANTICEGNDSRLSNPRTPVAHASTHQFGGSDPVHHVWQWGTGAPPSTAGLPDGAIYIKYIP